MKVIKRWWRSPARNDDIFYGVVFGSLFGLGVYEFIGWLR